jgi:hypothetical protein
MSNVVNLAGYRRKTRKAFLTKYGSRLERFVESFVNHNLDVDFRQLAHDYQVACQESGASWDYVHFREVLSESIDAAFGAVLYQELLKQPWFDERYVTKDEIIDRCLTAYIMDRCHYAIES